MVTSKQSDDVITSPHGSRRPSSQMLAKMLNVLPTPLSRKKEMHQATSVVFSTFYMISAEALYDENLHPCSLRSLLGFF